MDHCFVLHMFIWVLTLLSISSSCFAEIRYTSIISEYSPLVKVNWFMNYTKGHLSPFFIDFFVFTETGHLQLNISHISFSPPNPTYNLSQIGFFFAPRKTQVNRLMYGTNHTEICYLHSNFTHIIYTFDNNKSFNIEFSAPNHIAVADLYFQNCLAQQLQLSMDIRSAMYNVGPGGDMNYLSDGKDQAFGVYFTCICIYICFTALMIRRKCWEGGAVMFKKIHYVMLFFLVLRQLGFVIELVNLYCIRRIGYATSWVLLFTCVSGLFSGVPMLALVGLIGSGWSYLKPKLQPHDKNALIIVISFRIVFNIYIVSRTITSPCDRWCIGVPLFSRFFNFVGFIVLFFLFGWTSGHLLHAGQIEGKATLIFTKVKMLRKIFFFVLIYNFVQLLVGGMVDMNGLMSKYLWVSVVFGESTILILCAFIGYHMWPEVQNKFLVTNNDEEMAAAEALKDTNAYYIITDLTPFQGLR